MTEMPSYPAPGAGTEPAAAAASPRPGTINGAFWAFIVSMLVGLVGGVLLFFTRGSITDAMRTSNAQSATKLTDAQIDQAVTIGIVAGAVVAIVFALLHLLFAFKLRAGRNWARIVLTVLTVLQVLSLLVGQGSIVGYLSAVVAVIGVVLSFLPESNRYFAAVKTAR
ncbi:hypothetical protein [Amycolatopsis sp. PS_44_ISF1]|uniref:hypothetical protein n=1 Tax=Amycolatopsis sp. PS_44_ISF1 TaxID=2974917 RepID=UPI0028DDAC65|nr:hypothetical protein [Amycolatopsis sp. PS_44_ISF1]MDT8915152.1 hypothetical protein [Amycolatopsis sp. PS_44_ISF1]